MIVVYHGSRRVVELARPVADQRADVRPGERARCRPERGTGAPHRPRIRPVVRRREARGEARDRIPSDPAKLNAQRTKLDELVASLDTPGRR